MWLRLVVILTPLLLLDGILKLNVDAAVIPDLGFAASAVIVRDSSGAMLTGSTRRFPCDSVVRAEAEAMLDGVRFALALGIHDPMFEGDNLVVINACNGVSPPWQALSSINAIRSMVAEFSSFSFTWIPRASKRTLPAIWSWIPPIFLRAAILKDMLVLHNT